MWRPGARGSQDGERGGRQLLPDQGRRAWSQEQMGDVLAAAFGPAITARRPRTHSDSGVLARTSGSVRRLRTPHLVWERGPGARPCRRGPPDGARERNGGRRDCRRDVAFRSLREALFRVSIPGSLSAFIHIPTAPPELINTALDYGNEGSASILIEFLLGNI